MKRKSALAAILLMVCILLSMDAYTYAAKSSPTQGSGSTQSNTSTSSSSDSYEAAPMDPERSKWAESDIDWMIANKIVPDNLQGNYKHFITREEYASLVYEGVRYLVEKSTGKGELFFIPRFTRFEDADSGAINTAYAIGVVNGISPTAFKPKDFITREQGAVMMANMLSTVSVTNLSEVDYGFTDKTSISNWAVHSVNICGNAKIFVGTGKGFHPMGLYSREQAIVTVRRLMDAAGDKVKTIKIRNKLELPIESVIGSGLFVGDNEVKFQQPASRTDTAYVKFIEGLSKILSDKTIAKIRESTESGELQDGSYSVTYKPFAAQNLSSPVNPNADDMYIIEISW